MVSPLMPPIMKWIGWINVQGLTDPKSHCRVISYPGPHKGSEVNTSTRSPPTPTENDPKTNSRKVVGNLWCSCYARLHFELRKALSNVNSKTLLRGSDSDRISRFGFHCKSPFHSAEPSVKFSINLFIMR